MRRVLSLWWMLAMLLGGFVSPVRAADLDAVSPLVSYLYLDTLAETPSQPNVVSPPVSYLYLDTITDPPSQPNVGSPLVSYLYLDSLVTPPDQPNVVSPLVSYLFYDWVGDENLAFQSSLPVSFHFHPSTTSGPVTLLGQVTDANGLALSGVTISAAVGLKPVAQTTTDVSGNYALPPLDAGVYALTASASGHARSARVLTLSAGTAVQDFRLVSLPATPSTTPVNRQPAAFIFPPIGSFGEGLKVFDGTEFINIGPANAPNPDRITIVLTHGWIPQALGYEVSNAGIEGWPTTIAKAMKSQGITTSIANILAWDWRYAAQGTLPPEEHIPGEGVLLGQSLQTVLGAGYTKPIHFMGHSLGALVNAAAANYLHGDRTAQQTVSPTPWSAARTHMTLFDHAEVSRIASAQVLFDGLTLDLSSPIEVLKYASETLQGWKPSMPVQSGWADNYISLVGFYMPNTLNVALQKAQGYAGILFWQAHSYPMTWYDLSIASPTFPANPLGFKRSYEYARVTGGHLPFPPPVAELTLGDAYHQTPSASDQLALERLPLENIYQLIVPLFGNGADFIVQTVNSTVQIVGDVTAEIVDSTQAAARWVWQGFKSVGNVAVKGGQTVLNMMNSPSLRLSLTTGLPPSLRQSSGQAVLSRGPIHPSDSGGDGATNLPPMAWLPIRIPTNAAAMAFDFTVAGNPFDDVLVCGIGETNLFSLEAKYIPTNTISSSRLMNVLAWAGTTNELFFGFLGGTSTNATLTIENIRFYSLEVPRLQITPSGSLTLLTWPTTAGNYVVETTSTLSLPIWEAMTNAPAILADRYILTNSWSDQSRFFRLRQR